MTTGILLHRRLGHTYAGQVAISALCALSLLGVAAGLALSWRDSLPDPIASHWSGTGAPDGFMSLGAFVTALVVTGVLLVALFTAIGVFGGRTASARRLSVGMNVWIGGFLGTVLTGSLWAQRGLSDAAQALTPGWVLLASVLGPGVLGLVAAMLVPGDPRLPATGPVEGGVGGADLAPGERAAWIGRSTVARTAVVVEVVVVLATLAAAALSRTWVLLGVSVLVVLLTLTIAAVTVRVDASGLTVRSALGLPRTHIPADEVLRASATTVNPLGEFGGWGWRVALDGSGRTGMVLRRGEALVVERSAGRTFVVTVDGAAEAAALLTTMAERARPEEG